MRAVVYESFGGPLEVRVVPDPVAPRDGVVVAVEATGVCRSDRHGWQGHDPGIRLPQVPGHELAGTVAAVGPGVRRWQVGDRVTVPFVCACGSCPRCAAGQHQVCDRQSQPGFTHWGSFAELVALRAADVNLVALPDALTSVAAASLGCRFGTAFRAITERARVRPGEWVAVHGCGGVGLSAVQVAVAAGGRVVAVDLSPSALALAERLGAEETLASQGWSPETVAAAVLDVTGGGAHASLDTAGTPATCEASVRCLRPLGRHVQVGLLPPEDGRPAVPMDRVLALELVLLGSHGIAAHAYPELLGLVVAGRLQPRALVTRELPLEQAGAALREVGTAAGIAVVRP